MRPLCWKGFAKVAHPERIGSVVPITFQVGAATSFLMMQMIAIPLRQRRCRTSPRRLIRRLIPNCKTAESMVMANQQKPPPYMQIRPWRRTFTTTDPWRMDRSSSRQESLIFAASSDRLLLRDHRRRCRRWVRSTPSDISMGYNSMYQHP